MDKVNIKDVWDIEELFVKHGLRFDADSLEEALQLGKKIIETIENGEKPSEEDFKKCEGYINYLDLVSDEIRMSLFDNNIFPFARYITEDFFMFRDVNESMYYIRRSNFSYVEPDVYRFFMGGADRTLLIKMFRDYSKSKAK